LRALSAFRASACAASTGELLPNMRLKRVLEGNIAVALWLTSQPSFDMVENKTQRTNASVAAFLGAIPDPHRQRDAKALASLIRKATGERPAMWGSSIVGYGQMTYEGSKGRTVDWFPVGFAPRKAALVLYLMGGLKVNANLLAELGPHKVGGGCLYLPRLEEIDTKVLTRLIRLSDKGNRQRATAPKRAAIR